MKTKVLYIVIFQCIFFIGNLFSINFSAADLMRSVKLDNNKIIFDGSETWITEGYYVIEGHEEYNIEWEIQNGISFISFNYDGKMLGNETHGLKKYLVLYDETKNFMFLTLYNSNNDLIYEIFGWKYTVDAGRGGRATASSELREGNIIYSIENLINVDHLIPWAEGVDGSGIGQKINMTLSGNNTPNWFGLLFSNGYVDYNRTHLYSDNNRVKKIRIYFGDLGNYMDFDIKDTPNYQYLQFPYAYQDYFNGLIIKYITIEILEVYRGNKWDDTCINLLYVIAD
jgi:hypothetical protein